MKAKSIAIKSTFAPLHYYAPEYHAKISSQSVSLSAHQAVSITPLPAYQTLLHVGVREWFNRTSLDGIVGRCESLWHRTCRDTMSYSNNCVDYEHKFML